MKIIFQALAAVFIINAVVPIQGVYALVSNQQVEKAMNQVIQVMKKGYKDRKIPGSVLVVVRRDKVMCTVPFGYSKADKQTLVTTETIFPVSSVSKNVTAFLVGALVDAGKLKWNDKVRKYDKNFFVHSEEYSKELTIKDLISHCSGFPNFAANSLWDGGYSKKQTIEAFKEIKQIPGDFRRYYAYQNVFFGLIGDVLEKATGEKYEDLVQKYLFDKMDMKNVSAISTKYETSIWGHIKYLNSRFEHDKKRFGFTKAVSNYVKSICTFKPKKSVTGYSYCGDGIIETPEIGFFHVYPATSGIAFSATDFAKWIQMVLAGGKYGSVEIVKPQTYKEITSPVVDMKTIKPTDETFPGDRFTNEGLHYGVGTFIAKYTDNGKNPKNILFHMGGVHGATAFFVVCPEEDLGVGVINNLGGTTHTLLAEYMCNYFLDLCFGYSYKDWLAAETNRQQRSKLYKIRYETELSDYSTPMAPVKKYTGTYSSKIYGDVTVKSENGKLILSNGKMSTELKHLNGNIFSFPERNMQICFSDLDDYIAFYADETGTFNSCKITCFAEANTLFKRKDS